MGFSWSSYIAQCTMTHVCRVAGLNVAHQLADDLPSPGDSECFGLATDDIILFSRQDRASCERTASRLDRAFAQVGVERHPGKDVTGELNATAIGIDIVNGLMLWACAPKLRLLLAALHFAITIDIMTPLQMAGLLGHVQWFNLLNRSLFAALDHCYLFARKTPQKVGVTVPVAARVELACVIGLSMHWCFDMQKPWLPMVIASDASPAYGFGVCKCDAPVDVVRDLGRCSEKRGDFIILGAPSEIPDAASRIGRPHRIPLSKSRFSTVISAKTRFRGHPGLLEAQAVRLAVEWVARAVDRVGHRVVLLIDAKAVLGAVAKGRSSARTIKRIVARISALVLATDITLHLLYVPTEWNPADAPSRGPPAPRLRVGHVRKSPLLKRTPQR
jgi:hypothetical protein